MKNKRHVVNVMRPSKAKDSRGHMIDGDPSVLMKDVPCSIRSLNGRELIQARTVFAEATHEVEFYGDPRKPLDPKDYLQFGKRTLAISFANDLNHVEYKLLCGERVNG